MLSKEEEIKRCQDTVTRLILAFRGLDQHDRSGRSALEAKLEEEKSKLLSLGRMVTTVTGSGFGFYDISGPDVLQHVLDPRTRVESVLGGESKALKALGQPVCLRDIMHTDVCHAMVLKTAIGPKFWSLCAKRAEDSVCGTHAAFHDRADRENRILEILLPYGFISSETGVEHLYQVSADVMRMWCSSVGMDISQVPPPVESSLKMGTLSGELTVVGQHQLDRVNAALGAGAAAQKSESLTPPANLLTPEATKPPAPAAGRPKSKASLAEALKAVPVTSKQSFSLSPESRSDLLLFIGKFTEDQIRDTGLPASGYKQMGDIHLYEAVFQLFLSNAIKVATEEGHLSVFGSDLRRVDLAQLAAAKEWTLANSTSLSMLLAGATYLGSWAMKSEAREAANNMQSNLRKLKMELSARQRSVSFDHGSGKGHSLADALKGGGSMSPPLAASMTSPPILGTFSGRTSPPLADLERIIAQNTESLRQQMAEQARTHERQLEALRVANDARDIMLREELKKVNRADARDEMIGGIVQGRMVPRGFWRRDFRKHCEQLDTASQIRAASLAGGTVDPHEIEKKACEAYCLGALPIDVVGELFSDPSFVTRSAAEAKEKSDLTAIALVAQANTNSEIAKYKEKMFPGTDTDAKKVKKALETPERADEFLAVLADFGMRKTDALALAQGGAAMVEDEDVGDFGHDPAAVRRLRLLNAQIMSLHHVVSYLRASWVGGSAQKKDTFFVKRVGQWEWPRLKAWWDQFVDMIFETRNLHSDNFVLAMLHETSVMFELRRSRFKAKWNDITLHSGVAMTITTDTKKAIDEASKKAGKAAQAADEAKQAIKGGKAALESENKALKTQLAELMVLAKANQAELAAHKKDADKRAQDMHRKLAGKADRYTRPQGGGGAGATATGGGDGR